ncbi:YadA C-terminal domain-containing protein [Vibrio atypicus]|uniref:YadA C-terminal domain-containing protein n=1 Tax=Vibrio atypicus TaxID=558271 RepID=UPI001359F7EA|nr:YadA C-terminal domain-containing protein [Vibrio atypicus]
MTRKTLLALSIAISSTPTFADINDQSLSLASSPSLSNYELESEIRLTNKAVQKNSLKIEQAQKQVNDRINLTELDVRHNTSNIWKVAESSAVNADSILELNNNTYHAVVDLHERIDEVNDDLEAVQDTVVELTFGSIESEEQAREKIANLSGESIVDSVQLNEEKIQQHSEQLTNHDKRITTLEGHHQTQMRTLRSDVAVTSNKIAKRQQAIAVASYGNKTTAEVEEQLRALGTDNMLDAVSNNAQSLSSARTSIAKNSQEIADMKADFQAFENQTNVAFASMTAMANIPLVEGYDFSAGAGLGYYAGEAALSVGGNYKYNDNITIKASFAGDPNQWQPMVGAGVAVGW